jgi:hypothetical protein
MVALALRYGLRAAQPLNSGHGNTENGSRQCQRPTMAQFVMRSGETRESRALIV